MSYQKDLDKEYRDSGEKNKVLPGTLYVVGTPIGNLSDLSDRAKKILSEVDFVAAEDTRNGGWLLSRFGVKKPLISYFEHNKRERGEIIISRLAAGESCALITDAGMPAISDPGEDLVRLCRERGVAVSVVPGPCAAVCALAISGMVTSRFSFEGFISTQKNNRRERLLEIKDDRRTLIFYEAPHRLLLTLKDLFEYLGDREIALCRELTKLNEEVRRTTLSEAVGYYTENTPRGEYVIIVAGAEKKAPDGNALSVKEHVDRYIADGMTKNDAIKQAAKDRGVSKSTVYSEYLRSSG